MAEILDEHGLRNRYHVFEDRYHAGARVSPYCLTKPLVSGCSNDGLHLRREIRRYGVTVMNNC